MEIRESNVISYPRPDEYQGTIAIDHLHQPGGSIATLLAPAIESYKQEGFRLVGFKISTLHIHDIIASNQLTINALIKRDTEFKFVTTTVNAIDFLRSITWIGIQVSEKSYFLRDEIDWNKIEEVQ